MSMLGPCWAVSACCNHATFILYWLVCPSAGAAVANQVHELIGGPVEHCGNDDRDLHDDTKVLQRLYSMNVMRLHGLEPVVELWQVSA